MIDNMKTLKKPLALIKNHMKDVMFSVHYIAMVSQNRQNEFPLKVRKEMEERFISYVENYNKQFGTSIYLNKRTIEDVDKNVGDWKKLFDQLKDEYETFITPVEEL